MTSFACFVGWNRLVPEVGWRTAIRDIYVTVKFIWPGCTCRHWTAKGPITWRISARAEISARLTGLKLQPGF